MGGYIGEGSAFASVGKDGKIHFNYFDNLLQI
jgi:hypothetical protein